MSLVLILLFKITAAANTGPARHPLPTSSTPANLLILDKFTYIFKILDFSLIIFKSIHDNFFCSGCLIRKAG